MNNNQQNRDESLITFLELALDKDKKMTAEQNEDLERNLKAKEEANQKRLLAKLQRDKNPHIKELISKVEQSKENTDEFSGKLREETDKHDQVVDALVELKERLKIRTEEFEELKTKTEGQDEKIAGLKETIDGKQADVNKRLKVVEEARKINLFEDEKNRKYQQANAALRAKLDFIEAEYDYTSSVKQLSLDDFKELMNSNTHVNETIDGFTSKLGQVQKEI